MKVLDHEHYAWFLFEKDGALLLDAVCSHSAFTYSWMIELNSEEVEQYKSGGREYLSRLAHDIHYSAPAVRGNTSKYKDRDVTHQYREEVSKAIEEWRAKSPS